MPTCTGCGATVPDGARFCPECGTALVHRPDERRLVTVLMADIVGFTRLSEVSDPEHVKNLVDRCFQRLVADVVAFGGHLDKIVGDQLVAQFGAPVAHEDDAERAVRCALTMQTTLTTFAAESGSAIDLRIGINTGEVVVGALRAGGDATVMGDVVNTASRLQTAAAPGQVIVGPLTYDATHQCVRYESLGALEVRGRTEPVESWIALEATHPPGRHRRRVKRAPLVGREPELGILRHAFRIAARGRAHLVELYGDAGVGKSRLAMEFAYEAREDHEALVVGGQCVPYGEANVWAPLAEAVRAACGFERDATLVASREAVTAAVAYAIDLPHGHTELDRIVDGLLFLTDGFTRPGVDPTRARDEAWRALGRFFEGHATRRPVVLVMSDVHWAGTEIRGALERLLVRLRSLPFVLVATARPDFAGEWTSEPGRHNHVILHLEPLDADAAAMLIGELFGSDAQPALVDFLLERSGGNPFFIEELATLVLDACGDGAVDLTSDAIRSLPATLHGLVAARLDTLDASHRSVLEDFAVVGASGNTADALALGDRADGKTIARALADRDLVELVDGEFRFKSELVREVAYGTLTRAERARRHSALAHRLEDAGGDARAETAAFHLATAAELVEDLGSVPGVPGDIRHRALDALVRSAQRAEAVEHHERAGRLWERVLQLADPDDTPRMWAARLGRSRARDAFRDLDAARDDALIVLEEARSADDRPVLAEALLVLGRVEADAHRYDEAERAFGEALTTAREIGNDSFAAEALRGLGMARLFQGEDAEAERLSSDALAAFRGAGDRRGEAWALQNLAWIAFARGATTTAEQRLNESAEAFAEIGDWGGVGWALGLLAFVRYNQGRLDEAEELARQIGHEMDTGDRWALGMMEILLADIALWRGRSEECVERGRSAIELFRTIGDHWAEVQATAPVVRALTKLGRFGEANDLLDSMMPAVNALADHEMRGIGPAVRAATHLERGDPAGAIAALGPLGYEPRGVVVDADLAGLHGLALLQSGRIDEAISVVRPVYEQAEADGARASLGGLLALALAAAGRPTEALEVGREVARVRGGTYMDRLLLHWATGFAFAQQGLATDAVAALDEAHAIAFATDARIDRAVASMARARAYEHLGVPAAREAQHEADLQLHALGISAQGWDSLFGLALAAPDTAGSTTGA
jgi:class 3 adenylate cyclase/tetratricopeptide (TPR) repeat protein